MTIVKVFVVANVNNRGLLT